MPCYSRITSEVQFTEKTDIQLLARALTAMGLSVIRDDIMNNAATTALAFSGRLGGQYVNGTYTAGRLEVRGTAQVEMNQFKRAYSTEVVKAAAQRFGWTVQQKADNQFQVQRRY